jgi:hypothetical protein
MSDTDLTSPPTGVAPSTEPGAARPGTRRDAARRLVTAAHRASVAYGRPDLADRLDRASARLDDPRLVTVVLGEFKAGKSSLVNAIVGAEVCPVDADVATAVPTMVRHADTPVALASRRAAEGAAPTLEPVEPAHLAELIRREGADWSSVEIGLPRRILADGLVLVDTPGVGGLDARHLADALGLLSVADVVLFASDGANELGGPTLELLAQVAGIVPSVALVLTKADLHHRIDRIVDANRHHLERAGLDLPMFVVSAELRTAGIAARDAELDEESGVPGLLAHLEEHLRRSDVHAAGRTARTVIDVATQLRSVFEAELAALRGAAPDSAVAAAATPPAHVTSWQQLLADDITDLTADLDHELRRRSRELAQAADAALAEGDPAELWPEVSAWLEERAAADVVDTFALLRDRTTRIAQRVAERFELTEGSGAPVDPATIDDLARRVLQSLPERASLAADGPGRTASGLNALRSSFYGFTMFSSIGLLVGIAAAPAALVLGLALGAKSVRDDRTKGQQQRRAHARGVVRTYLDEVGFVAGKESRDALRVVQRSLRDHFTALAAEQQRSTAEAAAAARRAAAADAEARTRRAADVEAELGRLDLLQRRAADLVDAARAGGAS